ncbi:hypothetical protein [Deinococcus ruber]|uniref:Uncharacterized protein n=1 Tax=Deinococcus ruber TaxID=1848197 RepID=A0A918CGG5_9DEIO|nr:hypothetical protein [Deinococcus ruber]GGR21164.1 hypothetical protein GCM10008957_36800 [Deinococcus ruber]
MTPPLQLITPAALAVLQTMTSYSYALAHVTRDPGVSLPLMDVIGCRSVELLEVYVRRVIEHIIDLEPNQWLEVSDVKFTARDALTRPQSELIARMREEDPPRLASNLPGCTNLLGRFLDGQMFTSAQLQEIQALKDLRNLIVHNDGVVDTRYARTHSDAQLGDRLNFSVRVLQAVLATLRSVQHIDALLLARYPQLAQPEAPNMQTDMMRRLHDSFTALAARPEELALLGPLTNQMAAAPLPFSLPPLLTGFGTFWLLSKGEMEWWTAYSIDGRAAAPFVSEDDARQWVGAERFSWNACRVEELHEDGFAILQDETGLTLRWPQSELPSGE